MRDIEPHDSRESPFNPPGRRKPSLPNGAVVVRRTADELLDAIATDLFLHANICVRQFGDFQLALSSWQEAEPLFLRLLYDPRYRELPWRRTHLWIVEERLDLPQPNFELLAETVVSQSDIPQEQVHPVTSESNYEDELQGVLGWREKGQDRLDYALLPLLADGFTHGSPLKGSVAPLIETGNASTRMTRRLIEATRFIAAVALGTGMAPALQLAATTPAAPGRLLPRDVRPIGGELRWYVQEGDCQPDPGAPNAALPIPLE